jgi:hypothetical protein
MWGEDMKQSFFTAGDWIIGIISGVVVFIFSSMLLGIAEQAVNGVILLLIALMLGAANCYSTMRLRRKKRELKNPQVGFCKKCHYNLTGNTTGICPECGTPINSPPEVSTARE